MPLTKTDLHSIRSVVREEVSEQLIPVREKLEEHTIILNEHSIVLNEHSSILKEHSQELKYLRETANYTIEYIEEEDAKIKKNVSRIEQHLELQPLS